MKRTAKNIAPPVRVSVQNCTFNAASAASEHTRAAAVVLAEAAKENAVAIGKIADALKGGNATFGTAIHIGGTS